MDLLLDVNIVLDICAVRMPYAEQAADAIQKCLDSGGKLWIYAGSIQTLEYTMVQELTHHYKTASQSHTKSQIVYQARQILKVFTEDKHWLAALSSDCAVFDSPDPEDEQLIQALTRFTFGSIKLLTRDKKLQSWYPQQTISPVEYLGQEQSVKPINFIDLAAQQDHLRPQLEQNIHRVLHHGQYIMGPEVKQLEEKLAAYTGAKHCITVASGTEALLISLMAIGIKPGDEVITTAFSFIATAEVIVLLGAKPVFIDIEPDTCNINAALIEQKITDKTKAIMPVSLYGQPADMDEINAIAAKYNLVVIEDAAQSFGATYKGKKSCNLSTIGCTSFFPSKPLGCYGDGGAIFTSNDSLAQAMREIRVHGQSKRYVHTRIGVGGRMDTLQCAIVLAKLERFDWEIEQRISIGSQYNESFKGKLQTITQRPDRTSVFGQYTVLVNDRELVQVKLKDAGIPTAVHYPVPMHLQPAYQYLCCPECNPESVNAANRVMSLPMHPNLDHQSQRLISELLIEVTT